MKKTMKTKHILKEEPEKFDPYNFLKTAMSPSANCFPRDKKTSEKYPYITKHTDSYNKTECDKGAESTIFNPCGYALFVKSGKDENKDKSNIYILPNKDKTFTYLKYNDEGKLMQEIKNKPCSSLSSNVTATTTKSPDKERIIEYLKGKNYITEEEWDKLDVATKDTYTKVDVSKDEETRRILDSRGLAVNQKEPIMMYKPSGLASKTESKTTEANNIIKDLKSLNWKTKDEITIENSSGYDIIDMGDPNSYNTETLSQFKTRAFPGGVGVFQKGYYLYEPRTNKTAQQVNTECQLALDMAQVDYSRKSCRQVILCYFMDYNSADRNTYPKKGRKEVVEDCIIKHQHKLPGLKQEISQIIRIGPPKEKWRLNPDKNYYVQNMRESQEVMLKNIVSESLQKLKKKKTINESQMIQKRLVVLSEGKDLRNKRELNLFFNKFLIETTIMNSKGYDSQLVSEGFFDFLGGMFGTGVESVMSYFKEYAAKWLLNIAGIDSKGWIGTVIKTALGNLKLGEVTKLTSCDFLVPYLAKTISEAAAAKYMEGQGSDSPISTILRNAVFEVLEDSAFGQAIEKGLESLICPKLGNLKTKMNNVQTQLTDKAELAKEAEPTKETEKSTTPIPSIASQI